jgi:hypothetical protein
MISYQFNDEKNILESIFEDPLSPEDIINFRLNGKK